jgi:hypothetical protein
VNSDPATEIARLNAVITAGAETVNDLVARVGQQAATIAELRSECEAAKAHAPVASGALAALVAACYHLWAIEASHADGGASAELLADARLRWLDALVHYDTTMTRRRAA